MQQLRPPEEDVIVLQGQPPWWQQLWPWLLISGPAIAMLGCIVTIWLAVNLYADQPLREGVVQQGLKVEEIGVTEIKTDFNQTEINQTELNQPKLNQPKLNAPKLNQNQKGLP